MYKKYIKRILDFTAALCGLIILIPIILLITIVLLFVNRGKPLFFQERPGKNERIFKIYKFKSMTDETDANGNLLPNDERVTKFGTFLRKSSLDEIPQLFNVLIGDMSLIGPRPLRVHYLPYYKKSERIRHSVRPGITGLAQVSGRNLLSWDDKLEKDIEYVENISFKNDFEILIKTFKKVIAPSDIDFEPHMLDLDTYRKLNNQL
ncbi:Sugar transferase involved in LPS biosynthesis (colanic, teichoic acid) [Zhouia amylolytica]|uniref:Sugar transferase involved in LPS biosynthesis (Colanic, teichoic acid) n=1 Tax=Zhouia amylolytica TaxID=376730 RepID=A0A1I6VKB4_9FLAO|nr:sugar transferase [Zhouia amylolytica]SFT14138.1 Sugar transferase involved in LPS biosynthesis (colanic, teichoic acid) [Zhouia amylolytica]